MKNECILLLGLTTKKSGRHRARTDKGIRDLKRKYFREFTR